MRSYQIYFKRDIPLSGFSSGDYIVISEDTLDILISGGVVYGNRKVNGVSFTYNYNYNDLSMIVLAEQV